MPPKAKRFMVVAILLWGAQTYGAAPPFQWVKIIGTDTLPTSLASDGQGNCYAAIQCQNTGLDLGLGPLDGRTVIAKFAGDGRLIWNSVLRAPYYTSGRLSVNSLGNILFVGSELLPTGTYREYVAKLDATGNVISDREFPGLTYVSGVKLLEDGSYVTAGSAGSGTVSKYDANDELIWTKVVGGSCEGLSINSAGEVYTTGMNSANNVFVTKFTAGGQMAWTMTAGGTGTDIGYGILGLEDGSCWASGTINSGNGGTGQFGAISVVSGGFLARGNGVFNAARNINNFISQELAIDNQLKLYSAETVLVPGTSKQLARVACYSVNGNPIWDHTWSAYTISRVAVNNRPDVFISGVTQGIVQFGNIPVDGGDWTYFLAKLGDKPAQVSPMFLVRPNDLTVGEGENFELTAIATGTPPISYRWFKDAIPLAETTTNLFFQAVSPSDAGAYQVEAKNAFGAAIVNFNITVRNNSSAEVTTIAGSGVQGYLDSTIALEAKFAGPDGVTVTKDGLMYVSDTGNQVIRYILPNGEVGTFAGKPGVRGYREDVGTNALFDLPAGLQIDSMGDLLITDYGNHRVRKILGLGYRSSSLVAGDGTPGLKVGVRQDAQLFGPRCITLLNGRIYFTEFNNHTVRSINSTGLVTVLAGSGLGGFKDGTGAEAQFRDPAGITIFGGALYVADSRNNRVRKVTTDGVVTTIAGSGIYGFKSGFGTAAELGSPNGICADNVGNLYFTEYLNNAVRRIDTNGWVGRVAGTGVQGFADGDRTQAMFDRPSGICMHPDGTLIVVDTYNHRIRRIVMDGKTNGWTRSGGFLTADLHPTLKVFGNIGERYRIETRDRLGQTEWSAVTSIVLQQSPTIWVDERQDGGMQRVYRAVKE